VKVTRSEIVAGCLRLFKGVLHVVYPEMAHNPQCMEALKEVVKHAASLSDSLVASAHSYKFGSLSCAPKVASIWRFYRRDLANFDVIDAAKGLKLPVERIKQCQAGHQFG
jgi:hypothetical protein